MPPVVLKRRHNIKGKSILPLIRKVKNAKTDRINLARVKSTTPTEELSKEDLLKEIRDITGENEKEILELAQKEGDGSQFKDTPSLLHNICERGWGSSGTKLTNGK